MSEPSRVHGDLYPVRCTRGACRHRSLLCCAVARWYPWHPGIRARSLPACSTSLATPLPACSTSLATSQVMSPFGPDDLYADWDLVEAVYNHALK